MGFSGVSTCLHLGRFQDVVDKIDLSAARDHKLADNRKEDRRPKP